MKNKFTNFIDLGNHVDISKKEILDVAIRRLQDANIFVKNLSTFTKEQINKIIPADKYEHLDYLFDNKSDITFKQLNLVDYGPWNRGFNISVVYESIIKPTNETLNLTAAFNIHNHGLPRDLEIEIQDIYLTDAFKSTHTLHNYSVNDFKIVDFYYKLLGDIKNNSLGHFVTRKHKLVLADVFRHEIYYSFSYNLPAGRRKNQTISKNYKTPDKAFAKKLKDFMEEEYTIPTLGKKIDDMVDDDIVLFKMIQI